MIEEIDTIAVYKKNLNMKFEMIQLSYPFSGLEPHIDEETMRIHYSKHYKAYTEKLNEELSKSDSVYYDIESLMGNISNLSPGIRNNGGGYYNHSLFFSCLSPGGTKISSSFLQKIENQFSCSFGDFKEKFKKESMGRFGSGWTWLCSSDGGKLSICSTPNQDNPLMNIASATSVPILGLDLWEHSYYLKYKNQRDSYIDNFWEVVNWEEVESRYNLSLV